MFVEFPARSEDQIKPVSINPLHVVAVAAAGQDSCEILTTVRSFWVQVPYKDVMSRLAAATPVAEADPKAPAR